MLRHKQGFWLLAIVLSVLLAVTGCSSSANQSSNKVSDSNTPSKEKVRVTLGSGENGGAYYIIGAAMADIISNNYNLEVTPEATGGSIENDRLVGNKQVEFALSSAGSINEALTGTGDFANKPLELRNVGAGGTMYQTIVVRKDSGIKTMADFKGKKIALGQPGGSSGAKGVRMLELAGLKKGDYTAIYLSWSEMSDAIKDKNIDVGIW